MPVVSSPSHPSDRDPRGAFTLIELLTVLAIIGILTGVLIPTTAAIRASAARTRTRLQFSQWVSAIEGFRQEYGAYPAFDPGNKVNGGATTSPQSLHPFHDVLTGHRRDGSALPEGAGSGPFAPESQNSRRISFLTFSETDIFSDAADATTRNLVHDAAEGTDIAVLVDKNLDGVINELDYAVLPAVSPPDDPSLALRPEPADFPTGSAGAGVRAGAVFYSAPPKARVGSQLVLSWK
jgi:prepilin-type N-terminal cleavage/methylation domain-containing protein